MKEITITSYDIFAVFGLFVSLCSIAAFVILIAYVIVDAVKNAIRKRREKSSVYVRGVHVTGRDAERFIKAAEEAERNRGSIDFTEQIKIMRTILEKSKRAKDEAQGD